MTTQDVVREFMKSMPGYAGEVLRSILPVVGVFLTGVNIGFAPVGVLNEQVEEITGGMVSYKI